MLDVVLALLIGFSSFILPVEEDSQAWDGRVMGNYIVGPHSTEHEPGRYVFGIHVEEWDTLRHRDLCDCAPEYFSE